MSSAQQRLAGVASTLSYPKGLLAGDVAIITGSAQGIGKAVALTFAREGAKIVVSDLDEKKAQAVADEIKASGGEAIVVAGDVTADDFAPKIVKATIDAFGKINHIVNNAGFTFDKMLHTTTDQGWDLILKVHLTAPFKIVREAAPYLRSKDPKIIASNRSIINVSSIAGLHGNTNYATAKAGILGFTKTIAKEWGPTGLRCNAAAFGYIESRLTQDKGLGDSITVGGTKIALGIPQPKEKPVGPNPLIPLGRPGSTQEAANAVLFLASPLASFISGHTLEVTGGQGI